MPLVRTDLIQGQSSDYRKTIGEVVYEAMTEIFDVPKDDRFQVITEHPAEGFISDHWFELLRLALSIKTGTVTASVDRP